MARITDLLAAGRCFSIEMWPPRTPAAEARLEVALAAFVPLRPAFVSITYGAGGSTRERTHDLVVRLHHDDATAMAHLVCAAHSRAELVEILTRYREAGIENVLALRGDPPLDAAGPLVDGDLHHALELVELAKTVGPFCVAVAAHPEGHPDAPDLATDRRRLAEKLRIADFAITQFFFRIEDYLGLVDDMERLGVSRPILPGILPITNARTLDKMAEMSDCVVPPAIRERIDAAASDPDEVRRIGVAVATELGARLLDEGVPGLHFYTMNDARATSEVYDNLGLAAATSPRKSD